MIDEIETLKPFDMKKFKELNKNQLEEYYKSDVSKVLQYYHQYTQKNRLGDFSDIFLKDFDLKEVKKEYQIAKIFIHTHAVLQDDFLLSQMMEVERFKNIAYFFMLYNVLILTSVEPERIFSFESKVKTKIRNQLKIEALNKLMLADLIGSPLQNFDFDLTIQAFKNKSLN